MMVEAGPKILEFTLQAHPRKPCASSVFLQTASSDFSLNFFSCSYLETLFLFFMFSPPQSGLYPFAFAVRC